MRSSSAGAKLGSDKRVWDKIMEPLPNVSSVQGSVLIELRLDTDGALHFVGIIFIIIIIIIIIIIVIIIIILIVIIMIIIIIIIIIIIAIIVSVVSIYIINIIMCLMQSALKQMKVRAP